MGTNGALIPAAPGAFRIRLRGLIALSAALIALGGVAGTAAAASPASRLDTTDRLAPALPPSGPYLATLKNISGEIASDIGHPLNLTLSVVINPTQKEGAKTDAYAAPEDASGGQDGPATQCVMYVNPLLYKAKNTAYVKLVLAHEVFHCFEAMDYPNIEAWSHAPAWLIEGESEWVGATIEPAEDTWWTKYLTDLKTPLFSQTYDAIGFYSLMQASGDDTWHLLDPMLRAGSSAAAYALASNTTLDLDWASSFARQSSFGTGWDASGPGITDARYNPDASILRNGTDLTAKVAPYANALIKFNPSSDVVDIAPGTINSRMHEANGDTVNNPDNTYCVHDCDQCPEMKSFPKLVTGTDWLSVTGNTAGATYSVMGKKAMCNGSCMIGNWMVTSMTLTTAGGSFIGGQGTEVDIAAGGATMIDFTPGAPLGAAKFSGVETSQFVFPGNPAETSGTFSVGSYNTSGADIDVAGRSQQLMPGPSGGTFTCTGTTGLALQFIAADNQLDYTMVRGAATSP
jgi:hypothetical protein